MSTPTISAKQVAELRKATGAGMMDCKNALSETNGDIDAAIVDDLDLLRDGTQALGIGPVVAGAHQRLPGQLEQDAPERGR